MAQRKAWRWLKGLAEPHWPLPWPQHSTPLNLRRLMFPLPSPHIPQCVLNSTPQQEQAPDPPLGSMLCLFSSLPTQPYQDSFWKDFSLETYGENPEEQWAGDLFPSAWPSQPCSVTSVFFPKQMRAWNVLQRQRHFGSPLSQSQLCLPCPEPFPPSPGHLCQFILQGSALLLDPRVLFPSLSVAGFCYLFWCFLLL